MKTSGRCPKCECGKLYVIDEVSQPAHDSVNIIVPLSVTTLDVPASDVGLPSSNGYRAAIGHFQAWICSSCGLTEWYAKDVVDAFERALTLGARVDVRVATRPASEPYR